MCSCKISWFIATGIHKHMERKEQHRGWLMSRCRSLLSEWKFRWGLVGWWVGLCMCGFLWRFRVLGWKVEWIYWQLLWFTEVLACIINRWLEWLVIVYQREQDRWNCRIITKEQDRRGRSGQIKYVIEEIGAEVAKRQRAYFSCWRGN